MVELLQCLRACYPAESKQSKHGGTEVTEEVPYQTPCFGCKRIIKAPIDNLEILANLKDRQMENYGHSCYHIDGQNSILLTCTNDRGEEDVCVVMFSRKDRGPQVWYYGWNQSFDKNDKSWTQFIERQVPCGSVLSVAGCQRVRFAVLGMAKAVDKPRDSRIAGRVLPITIGKECFGFRVV